MGQPRRISFTVLAWVLGSPPVGVKVTSSLTFAVPLRLSFFFALPFALTASFTVSTPWGPACCFASPLPLRVRVPGPGTRIARVAVPFFLFRFSFTKRKRFEGFWLAGRGQAAVGANS